MTKLVTIDVFRAEQRRLQHGAGRSAMRARPDQRVVRVTTVKPKAYDDEPRKFRFCFSDGRVDRMGDTIDAAGWRINDFMANPVALWAHDSSAPPIGRASNVLVENDKLMGDITFADANVYEFADTIYKLVKNEFLNAVSVGFLPVEYDWSDDDDREWGIDFKVQELLEISVCPVPANPNALGAARAKGIDTRPLVEWAERALEGGGKVIIPRAELQRLRKAAKEPARPRRRGGDGLSETDPASGGVLVASCGREAADACGMIDPQECAVHRKSETDDKRLARLVARGVRAEIERLGLRRSAKPRRRNAEDGDAATEIAPEHQEAIGRAMDHLDAASDCFKEAEDHYADGDAKHDEGLDHQEKAMEELAALNEELGADTEAGEPDPDAAKARRKAKALRLRRQHENS